MWRVGLTGASAARGWAKLSHACPSSAGRSGTWRRRVRQPDIADVAAGAFGAKKGYGHAEDLFRDPATDLVTIAVKVPDHRDLVLAAIAAGKHIYCEWPLGRDLAEAEELAAAARAARVHVAIRLQVRVDPVVRITRSLIASGPIGRVLSARIVSTTMAFGPRIEPATAFAEDAANGVTLSTIQGRHGIDFAIALLGDIGEINVLSSTQYPRIPIEHDPAWQTRSTADHILLQGRLASGAPLSIELAGGRPSDATPFQTEILVTRSVS